MQLRLFCKTTIRTRLLGSFRNFPGVFYLLKDFGCLTWCWGFSAKSGIACRSDVSRHSRDGPV